METINDAYVISVNSEVATRLTTNNGKYLNHLGTSLNISYFEIPSSELFNLTSELKEGEGVRVETKENLKDFLPEQFQSNLKLVAIVA